MVSTCETARSVRWRSLRALSASFWRQNHVSLNLSLVAKGQTKKCAMARRNERNVQLHSCAERGKHGSVNRCSRSNLKLINGRDSSQPIETIRREKGHVAANCSALAEVFCSNLIQRKMKWQMNNQQMEQGSAEIRLGSSNTFRKTRPTPSYQALFAITRTASPVAATSPPPSPLSPSIRNGTRHHLPAEAGGGGGIHNLEQILGSIV